MQVTSSTAPPLHLGLPQQSDPRQNTARPTTNCLVERILASGSSRRYTVPSCAATYYRQAAWWLPDAVLMSAATTTTLLAPQEQHPGPSTSSLQHQQPQQQQPQPQHHQGVVSETLTLRLVPKRRKKAVKWSEDVVDNEFMNKKSSKKCCIFHKQRPFGEWSDDDSDTECVECE